MTDDAKLDGTNLLENEVITLDDALDALKSGQPISRQVAVDGMARWDLLVTAQLVPRPAEAPAAT